MILIILQIAAFMSGLVLLFVTLLGAVRTVVLPRAENAFTTRLLFGTTRRLFDLAARFFSTYRQRDRLLAFYTPITLLLLPILWLVLTTIAFTLMFWAVGTGSLYDAFWVSGSSLLTLGFRSVEGPAALILSFAEASIGLIVIALLIAYLPTMYTAFSERETSVTMLEVRAGSPPSAVEMINRYYRLGRLDKLGEVWDEWELWFVRLEETHSSLAPLIFFRSPDPDRSWITAAGAVLDTAAVTLAVVDIPFDAQAAICIRAGYLALRRLADSFDIPYDAMPAPDDPISIAREEFEQVCRELEEDGVPLKEDREQAWHDFAGWRVNYDQVLLALANLTYAPYAMWSSDRSIPSWGPLYRDYHMEDLP